MQNDFNQRYRRAPLKRPADKVLEKVQAATAGLAERLRQAPDRLAGLAYYEELMDGQKRLQELKILKKKVVGTFCYFVPEEIIQAAGAVPLRLCSGHSETITTAEELLPRDICPLTKSSLGFFITESGWAKACDVAVLPTSCDAKTKLGEYLSDYLPVWMLNLPKIKDYQVYKQPWLEEIKRLIVKLETLTGVKVTAEKLKTVIRLHQRRSEAYRKLYELRRQHPGILAHQDLLMLVQASFYDDLERWTARTETLVRDMQVQVGRKSYPAKGKKLLVTGGPMIWPNYKILNIVSELGSTVVADDMCVGHQWLWDYPEPDEWTLEGMLEAVATRRFFPTVCPCFTHSYDRIDKILTLAKETGAEGVIYHDLRLCQLFDMEKDLVNKVLKENKIPVLTLHSDYGQEDVEQLRTRIEAFLEMIL